MKNHFVRKNSGLTFSDYFFAIIFLSACYAIFLYVPLLYKSTELEAIVKDYTFRSGRASNEDIKTAIVEDARRKLEITILPDDVIVVRDDVRITIYATWHAIIELPFGYTIPRDFKVEYDRKQI